MSRRARRREATKNTKATKNIKATKNTKATKDTKNTESDQVASKHSWPIPKNSLAFRGKDTITTAWRKSCG